MIDTGPDPADQEEALWANRRYGRVLFESSPIPITVIDTVSFRSIDCNPAAVRMYGFASRAELLGQTPVDVSPPVQHDGTPSPAKAAAHIEQCLREGSVVFDWLHQRPDGTTWDAEVHLQLLHLGERELIQCSMLDITERKRAAEELHRLAAVVRNSGELVSLATLDGRMVFLNEAGSRMLGIAAQEVTQHEIKDVLPEAVRPVVQGALLPTIRQGKTWEGDLQYRNIRTGALTDVHAMAFGIDDPRTGAPLLLANVSLDITERKRAEETLRESEARLREVQEMAHLGHWQWDVRTGEVQWSEEVYKIFRLDPKTFVPRIDSIMALSPWPEDHVRDQELIRRAMESRAKGDYEQRFLRPDQSIGHYYSTFQGHYDENGALVSMVGSVMDITERKRAEEEIRKLNQELEERVRVRTAQLESANHDLDEFAYVVSHDLKAPLRAVSQLAHWVTEDYARVLDEEGKRRLDLMGSRIARMYALIDGILAYSRIGRTEERREPVDLHRLVGEVVEALAPPPHIRITIEGGLPVVSADRTRVVQVFQNLIGNAIKFMDKPDGWIVIRCADAGARWRFTVADNGPGIDPKYYEKVFRIFQTLAPRDQQESTGIGLTLVKRIVELYGGQVELTSDVGKGCTFSFTLPK